MTKRKSSTAAPPAPTPIQTKKDKFIAMLGREGGVSIAELAEAMTWLPHTTRAMLTGLRKKGYAIDKTKSEGVTRYSIAGEPAA
ncbi:MAG: DUF3489 domain-containing protein [Pseudomonadota bacterium]|nr:DUF3489 domain-containing protein [Pseudomonadota bacterium]